jgi:hypothetical protein
MIRGAQIAIAIVASFAAIGFIVASGLVASQILAAVNSKLPQEDQFEPHVWWFGKRQQLFREHRRLYPDGTLIRTHWRLAIAGLICFASAVWLFEHLQP